MTPLHVYTPTFESLPLSQRSGKTIYLKMECFQPCGSFKIRGLGLLAQHYVEQGLDHLVSSSGGNAGLAAAYAGRQLGVNVTVFLPSTSKSIYIDAIEREGAKVEVAGDVWDEANEAALDYVDNNQAGYIPPFDHPLIWQGHSTIIDEVIADGIQPDAVVVAVGGGGLACGVIQGLRNHGLNDVPVFGVETEGAESFAASLYADELVALPAITSIATSLGAKQVTPQLLELSHQHPVASIIVTDPDALAAARAFADDHRALIEPSSGAALAPLYTLHPAFENYDNILVVVCGGVGISIDLFDAYARDV